MLSFLLTEGVARRALVHTPMCTLYLQGSADLAPAPS